MTRAEKVLATLGLLAFLLLLGLAGGVDAEGRGDQCRRVGPIDVADLECSRTWTVGPERRTVVLERGRYRESVTRFVAEDGTQFLANGGSSWCRSYGRYRDVRVTIVECRGEDGPDMDRLVVKFRAAEPTTLTFEWEWR